MTKITPFTVFILIAALSSCMPEPLETEINPEQDRLVISSAFTASGTMWVSVTNSNGMIRSEKKGLQQLKDICVNDAVVTINKGNQCDTLRLQRWGIYTSTEVNVEPGTTYLLKAIQKSTGETVMSRAVMPYTAEHMVCKARKLKEFGDSALQVTLTFHVTEGKETFYMSYIEPQDDSENNSWIDRINPLLKNILKAQSSVNLHTSAQQKNGYVEVNAYFPHTSLRDTVQVMLAGIEKGYYHFLDQQRKSGTLFNRSTGDPIRFYGNIQNGYGYFSLYLPQLVKIPPAAFEK